MVQLCPICHIKLHQFIEFGATKTIHYKCPKCDLNVPAMDIPICPFHYKNCELVYNGRDHTLSYKCPISICTFEQKIEMEEVQ
jgi:hypothetical protein